jgi:hypothetical protein
MKTADKNESQLANPEAFRQWMLLYYKFLNLNEIEYHCELTPKSIYNDLAGNLRMKKSDWSCVYKELHAVFAAMPSYK